MRENPLFEIVLAENHFEIITDKEKNEIYLFESLNEITLKKEKIIWYLTILDFLLSLSSKIFRGPIKEDNEIFFFYEKVPKRYNLKNCDLNKASEVVEKIKFKLNKATHNTG
ncbi:hypothetical protein [Wenyingzhuangia sp. IMCC45467]